MKVCRALIEVGQPTTLVAPWRPDTAARLREAGDLRATYGLSGDVPIEWCRFPYPFTVAQQGLYAPIVALRALRRRVRLAYARQEWTASALAALRIPLICELHHLNHSPALSYLFREAARGRALALVCISNALRDTLITAGCPPAAICVAHDGVDLERFTPVVDRASARARLSLPTQPIVCHSGHLYEGRGIETLLHSASELPDVLFLFVGGTSDDVERHRRRAAAAGLANVRFTGHVPNAEVPLYLFAADVLAMPYTKETSTHLHMSPMKLFEYLAAGRPIVASDFPVLHEVLTGDVDVTFVPPSDAPAFAAALRRLLTDDQAARRMGEAGRRTAARYTWSGRQKSILEFAARRFHLASPEPPRHD